MIRRKGQSTRKLLNIKTRNEKKAKNILYLFQFLILTLSLITNIENMDSKSFMTYLLIFATTISSTFLVDKLTKGDNVLLLVVNMLFTIGVSMVYRIDPSIGSKQLMFYIIGIIMFFIVYFILKIFNKHWENLIWLYFIINIGLFLITLVLGSWVEGAKNWIIIGGVSIQPSEFIKIVYAFFVASFYTNYGKFEDKWGIIGRLIMTIGTYIFIGFFFIQRELGTAMVIFAAMILSQFVYEKDYKLITINIILMLIGLVFAYKVMSHIQLRFEIWKDPWADPNNKGYQIVQSLIAISSGSFFGEGLGLGHPNFIPVAESDFIFPAIIEEMGIFMGIAIVMLYLILIYKAFQIGFKQHNKFYSILSFVISSMLGVQTLLILGGVLKIVPLTGIVVPFLSQGGSAMISGFILISCLQFSQEEIKMEEVLDEEK